MAATTNDDGDPQPEHEQLQFAVFATFDPYESFFAGQPSAFRDFSGSVFVPFSPDAHALLVVAHQAARELSESREPMAQHELVTLFQNARGHLESMRHQLPLDTMKFQDEFGNMVDGPDRSDMDFFDILSINHDAATNTVTPEPEHRRAVLCGLWAMAALQLVDQALDAADGGDVFAAVHATMAVANARALRAMISGSNAAPLLHDFVESGREGGAKRWRDDPTQKCLPPVYREWCLWRADAAYQSRKKAGPIEKESLEGFAARMSTAWPGVKASTIRKEWHPAWVRGERIPPE